MKAASLKEIRFELSNLPPKQLQELCLRLAKYRKENKELLSYLLFEAYDEEQYIREVKSLIDELFLDINKSNAYFAKKSIRKILRITNKHIKFSGLKQTEVELLIHFCKSLKMSGLALVENTALGNMYTRLLKRIDKSLSFLHEDLQYDYSQEIRLL
jgi:hypothetical protein